MENDEAIIHRNISIIQETMERMCQKSGRNTDSVKLMAVTKTMDQKAVEAAMKAGITLFGENRVQEALEKYTPMPKNVSLHLIGHLQRNKAKRAAGFFACIESIDKYETAAVLDTLCSEQKIMLPILLEMNTSGEESKNGYLDADSLFRDLEKILELQHITVQGLMTIGPFTGDTGRIREAFSRLRDTLDGVKTRFAIPQCRELSMGMTGDYEIAIAEGSTIVRIGTGIFGGRNT
ncbi:MAG: YggS family pyridoxal phosphate-dependent enzyme [Spirochaetales bacterium]|nr:YggS family pyridoxal phosphate-dependent enzyme [Spirochaetales bacterium]